MAAPAGIARDSFPFCGERPQVRWWQCLPVRTPTFLTCQASGERCEVSGGSHTLAALTALGTEMATVLIALAPRICKSAAALAGILPGLLLGGLAIRLTLRLEPPEGDPDPLDDYEPR